MNEYAFKTATLAREIKEFGEAWLRMSKVANSVGLTMEEIKAKDEMDEAIKNFILLNQKRIQLVTKKLKEEREKYEDNI